MGHSVERLSRTFGIQGTVLEWFQSYLNDRMEHVLYNGVKSPVRPVLFGVPQGPVLGPLLFLLYTAEMNNSPITFCGQQITR